jgi:hypothetical protein
MFSREKEPKMNLFLSNELAGERIRDLREEAARMGRKRGKAAVGKTDRSEGLTVRRFTERDIDAIRRLAALDGKPIPSGAVLVGERAGELVAALPLDGGQALADPFKPTADVVELLRLRARQLHGSSGTRRSPRRLWIRSKAYAGRRDTSHHPVLRVADRSLYMPSGR